MPEEPRGAKQAHVNGVDRTTVEGTFTVGQAARMVAVSPSTIRLWERQGLIRPERRTSGHRRYTREDINHLRRVREAREAQRVAFDAIQAELSAERPEEGADRPDAAADTGIGDRLRTTRLDRGLSLRELARRTGVSASYASAIERGRARPSIAALQKLTAGLELTVAGLVPPSAPACALVKVGDARLLDIGVTGVQIENLAPAASMLEPQLFTVDPGAGSGGTYQHEGEEFVHVLEGTLEVWLDGTEHYRVQPGDSLCFSSQRGHRWRNPGRRPARVIWINTPPTF